MKGDIAIYDIESKEEHQFMIQYDKTGGYSFSGTPSVPPSKSNQEEQYGDFSAQSTFAQSKWQGQAARNYKDPDVGPGGIKRWIPSTLSYNIFPTRCFNTSEGIDIMKEDGELQLGYNQEEVHKFSEDINFSFTKCGKVGVSLKNSPSIFTSSNLIHWDEDQVARDGYDISTYDHEAELLVATKGSVPPFIDGYTEYRAFPEFKGNGDPYIKPAIVTDIISGWTEGIGPGSIKLDGKMGTLAIAVGGSHEYSIGQSVIIEGKQQPWGQLAGANPPSADWKDYKGEFNICGIDSNAPNGGSLIYLTKSHIRLVGGENGFNESVVKSSKIIYGYPQEAEISDENESEKINKLNAAGITSIVSKNKNLMIVKDAIKPSFATINSEPSEYIDSGYQMGQVSISNNSGAAKGENTISPMNAYGSSGLTIKQDSLVISDQNITFILEDGNVVDEFGAVVTYYQKTGDSNNPVDKVFSTKIAPEVHVFLSPDGSLKTYSTPELEAHTLLYSFYQEMDKYWVQTNKTTVVEEMTGEYLDMRKRDPETVDGTPVPIVVEDNRPTTFNLGQAFITTLGHTVETNLTEDDIDKWREGNRFIIETPTGSTVLYRSIMLYKDGKVRFHIPGGLGFGIGAELNKKKLFNLEKSSHEYSNPIVGAAIGNGDSIVTAGVNHVSVYDNVKSFPLYYGDTDYDAKNKNGHIDISINDCPNLKYIPNAIETDGSNFFVSFYSQYPENSDIYMVSLKEGIVKFPTFFGEKINCMHYQPHSDTLYAGVGESLYSIVSPGSSKRNIIKVKDSSEEIVSIVPFKNDILIITETTTTRYTTMNQWIPLTKSKDGLDYSEGVYWNKQLVLFGDDGEVLSCKSNDSLSGTLESSIYDSDNPGLLKHFNYAKVKTIGLTTGCSIRLMIKTSEMDRFEYLPVAPGGVMDNDKEPYNVIDDTKVDKYGNAYFFFPPNVVTSEIQYKIEMERDRSTPNPIITHIALGYAPTEQKELTYMFGLDLSDILEDATLTTEIQKDASKKLKFIERIWKERRLVKITTPDGVKRTLIPYSDPRDATNGFSVIAKNAKLERKNCKDRSYMVMMTFKNFYPLEG